MNTEETFKNAETKPDGYTLLGTMADYYEKAEKTASEVVEKMARQILREHPELNEFVMAMGTYFFTYKEGGNLDPISSKMNSSYNYVYYDTEPFLKPLNDFIGEWDSRLKITGDAMRFTAKSEKITDW
jgi:hypothetical protein